MKLPDLYPVLRPLLFCLEPETAHHLALRALDVSTQPGRPHLLQPFQRIAPVSCMGITFPNPVGLGAGLDKNGDHIDSLGALGFGFLEIGTVTPRPQSGNPRPRLFRFPKQHAIINRMGFNNLGVDHLCEQVKKCRYEGIIGINIGKNFDTPLEQAADDYIACLRTVYPVADYIAVNISSPNTSNLRKLQLGDELERLLAALKEEQKRLSSRFGEYHPIAVKVAPDMDDESLQHFANAITRSGMDGVIATNTTLSRNGLDGEKNATQNGGMSGAPLRDRATTTLRMLRSTLPKEFPLIGVGGILTPNDALEKIRAGATLVQLYSGFVFKGPRLVGDILRALPDTGT